jgi:hypothetical protein
VFEMPFPTSYAPDFENEPLKPFRDGLTLFLNVDPMGLNIFAYKVQ